MPQAKTPGTEVAKLPSFTGPLVFGSIAIPALLDTSFSGISPTERRTVSHSTYSSVPLMGIRFSSTEATVMDRLDTCIEKLNKYSDYPDSEEDFLVFMMFASMVTDAVKEILAQLGICKKKDPIYNSDEDYKYFREAYLNSSIFNPNAAIPTDEEFFQHFRSLSFAHPVETSRQKFLRKGETQYSPWVIVNRDVMRHRGYEDAVGVRIYSSLEESILDFIISFAVIKDYVRSRYERISLATKWVYEQIEATKKVWKTKKD